MGLKLLPCGGRSGVVLIKAYPRKRGCEEQRPSTKEEGAALGIVEKGYCYSVRSILYGDIFRIKWTLEKRQPAVSSQQLWVGMNANVCKCLYTPLRFLPPEVLLLGDTTALSLNLVCCTIWDWFNFTFGLSVTQGKERKCSLGFDNLYFLIVLRAYLIVVIRVCSFLWTWLLECCEGIFSLLVRYFVITQVRWHLWKCFISSKVLNG